MLLPFRSATGWPENADWERHKRTIAHLYLTNDRSLKEVMELMEHDHGFKATLKMYKTRFRKWGFRKNLKRDESAQFEAHTLAGERTSLPIVHGYKLGSKRLKSRAMKSGIQSMQAGGAESYFGTLLAFPRAIQAPGSYRRAEISLNALVKFSNYHFDDGDWISEAKKTRNQFESFDWSRPARQAAWAISKRVNMSSQFQILNKACDGYGKVMRKQDPFLMWATYQLILDLFVIGEDIAKSFVRLAAGISSIYLGSSHPMAILCTNVMLMDELEIRGLAIPLMEAQSELFRERTEQGFTFFPTFLVRTTKGYLGNAGGNKGILSLERAHQRVDQAIQWVHQHHETFPDSTQSTRLLIDAYICKACICFDSDNLLAAQNVLRQAEQWFEDLPLSKRTYGPLIDVTEIKAILFQKLGDYESAERYLREALDIAMKHLTGANVVRIGYSFEALRSHFEARGDLEAAEVVRLDMNNYLKSTVAEEPDSVETGK